MPERTRAEIQRAIAAMTVDEVRQALALAAPDLSEADAMRVRTIASRISPEAQKQVELAVYVLDDDPDPIAEAALDLLALEALKDRPVRASEPDPVVTADLGCEPPF
jgi:hypothetical protein